MIKSDETRNFTQLRDQLRAYWLDDLRLYGGAGTRSGGATIADINTAISAHEAATDPHGTYLTQLEGDGRYAVISHLHDDRYYTEGESDAKYALLTRNMIAGNGLTGTGTLAADVTFHVGVANTGAAGLTVETDAIRLTSSSNPGAAASILATSASGAVTINNGGSTTQPAITVGDGNTGRLAVGASGWLDDGTQFRMLGSRNFYVPAVAEAKVEATSVVLGAAAGSTASFRASTLTGDAWSVSSAGVATFADNTNTGHLFGMAKIGNLGISNAAAFGHRTAGATTYAFRQGASFSSYFNAGGGQWIYHRIADSDVMVMTNDRLMPAGSALKDLGDYNRKWRTLFAAELYVETLVAQDVISTIGGRVMVTPTTSLIADLASTDTTIDVKHNNLVNGSYIYMATAPSGLPRVEAMKITSGATAITGGYRYSVTRNLNGGGADNYVIGDAVASLGSAVGHGYIDLTATTTVHNHLGPTMAIYQRTGTAAWNDVAPVVAAGNLRSFVDYSSDTAGLAHGNNLTLSPTGGFSGMTSDNANGLRLFNSTLNMYSGGNQFLKLDTSNGLGVMAYQGTVAPTAGIYGVSWYRDTIGGNRSAYIASFYDSTNATLSRRGNTLLLTSYASPAGPSKLNLLAWDEAGTANSANIDMVGRRTTSPASSSYVGISADSVSLFGGGKTLTVDSSGIDMSVISAGILITPNGYGNAATTLKSEISNDATTYNALMLLGNKSGDSTTRRVNIYDHLYVSQRIKVGDSGFVAANLSSFVAQATSTASSISMANTAWGNAAHIGFNAYMASASGAYNASGAWRYLGGQYTGNITRPARLTFDGNSGTFRFEVGEAGLSSGADITTWTNVFQFGVFSGSAAFGFFGVTPVARPAAYTQTYATADRTIAARTSAALTNNTGGTVSTALAAITAGTTYTQADMVAVKNALASLADQVNKLRNDHLDTTQGLNAVIDDVQAYGLFA